MKPKILILAPGRYGKDTVAELLIKELPELTFISSSWVLAELIYEDIGQALYPDVESCFEDRIYNREVWYNWVCNYNLEDKAKLAKEILSKSDCYVGMRDDKEYEASKKLFDFVFYVDASNRVDYVDETMKISYDPKEMILLDNNGSIDDLKHQVKIAAEIIKGKAHLLCL